MRYVLSESSMRFLRGLQQGRAPASSTGETRRTRAMSIQDDAYAHPFEVRWATSANGWIIWLPSESCLVLDGQPVDIVSELDAAGGEYPAGWYKLGLAEGATSVYLNLTLPGGEEGAEEEQEPSAEFSNEEGSGDNVWSILVATMSGKAVRQTVDSALLIGGAAGVRSLNDLQGDLELVGDETRPLTLPDGSQKFVGVRTDETRPGEILLGFTDEPPTPESEGYCNEISHDSASTPSGSPDNDISNDQGKESGDVGGGGSGIDGNAISRWPCKKN